MAKILIADDEPDLELLVRQRFRRQIRDHFYDFHFAHNGAEALEKVKEDPEISVVLTDINMPVMDGLTLLPKLAEVNPLIQPVVVSAYSDMTNIRTAMNRGAFDFLTKPIDFQDFETTITKSLQQATSLKQAAENKVHLTTLQQELNVARNIQQSIVPRVFPPFPDRPELDIYATMLPARNVGGDYYDYFFIDRDRLVMVMGDVSGKGVPAALFMAISRTLLRAVGLRGTKPGDCLREVNDTLVKDNDQGMFITLFYCILDVRTGRLEYANGGHNPPYIVSPNGKVRPLPSTDDTVLGVMDELTYSTPQTSLEPGDLIFLYTDGITEAMNPQSKMFTDQRLQTFLEQSAGLNTENLIRGVTAAVREFAAGAPQSDDITALAVRYLGQRAEGE
jgi:sigma-B regulation protein RsbU (phosphoserine phosphatase)